MLPASYNYIGAFLTLGCNLRCSYCINGFGTLSRSRRQLSAEEWVWGWKRLRSRPDLPITLQGGEPSLHPGFYRLINGLRPETALDLLTNCQFAPDLFMARVPARRLKRDAPYASIRVSYHPEAMDLAPLIAKVTAMLDRGYSVGVWAVEHPAQTEAVAEAELRCRSAGIDFRRKEFLGIHQGTRHGSYTYEGAVANGTKARVECRTSELLIGPTGDLYRCHADLYADRAPYGHLLDPALRIEETFRPCAVYGSCNPCDVKTKTNRFQEFGHTSVEIRFQ